MFAPIAVGFVLVDTERWFWIRTVGAPRDGDQPAIRSVPRTVGVSPAQLASLRALPNRVMSPISASMTRAVNWPTPGQRGQDLDPRVGLGVLAQLGVDPVDDRHQAVDDRQAAGDDLPGDRGQDPARPASRRRDPVQ